MAAGAQARISCDPLLARRDDQGTERADITGDTMREPTGWQVRTVKLPPATIAEIERIAKKRDMTKAQVYRMLLDLGAQMHRDMEAVGVIAAVDFAYFCKTAIKEKLEKSLKGTQLHLPLD